MNQSEGKAPLSVSEVDSNENIDFLLWKLETANQNYVQEPNGTVPQKSWPAVLWLYWYLVVLLNPTKRVLETYFDRCSEAPLF